MSYQFGLCFGAHIPTSKGGIIKAIDNARDLGCDVMQIFSQSPRNLKGPSQVNINLSSVIKSKLIDTQMRIVSHSPYLINLAKDPEQYAYMADCLYKDLLFMDSVGGIGSVVHMGKCVGLSESEALDNMEQNIKNILHKYDGASKLILETSCGQGTELLYTLESIGEFYKRFPVIEKSKMAFCIDTCHIFVAGYDLRKPTAVDAYFNMFDNLIGFDKLALIHFNDSATTFDSHKDRHANIGSGYIGNPDKQGNINGLIKVIDYGAQYSIPMVLETPQIEGYVMSIKSSSWQELYRLNQINDTKKSNSKKEAVKAIRGKTSRVPSSNPVKLNIL
jgi:apurinic endonuclease APN1